MNSFCYKKKDHPIYAQPTPDPLSLFNNTHYHPLIYEDEVQYSDNSHRLQDSQYHQIIYNIYKNLQFLLCVRQAQFWQHLSHQQKMYQEEILKLQKDKQNTIKSSLRICLQSCLSVFACRQYMSYSCMSGIQQKPTRVSKGKMQWWCELKRVVLLVFLKISNARSQIQKQTVFQNWYIDSCKLLNLCLIYGQSNPEIVKTIIRNAITMREKGYLQDFKCCVSNLRVRLQQICQELKDSPLNFKQIDNNQEQLNTFQTPFQSLVRELIKSLFGLYDVFLNIQAIYNYFPAKCRVQVIKEALIFKRIILIYNKLRFHADFKWKLDKHSQTLYNVLNTVFQKIVSLLQSTLVKLNDLLNSLPNSSPHLYKAKQTFINICYFAFISPALSWEDKQSKYKQKKYKVYCQQLLKNILRTSPKTKIFGHLSTYRHFTANKQNQIYIKQIYNFQKSFQQQIAYHRTVALSLNKSLAWKMPNFNDYQRQLQTSSQQIERANQERKDKLNQILLHQPLKQYEDEPEDEENEQQTTSKQDQDYYSDSTETHTHDAVVEKQSEYQHSQRQEIQTIGKCDLSSIQGSQLYFQSKQFGHFQLCEFNSSMQEMTSQNMNFLQLSKQQDSNYSKS